MMMMLVIAEHLTFIEPGIKNDEIGRSHAAGPLYESIDDFGFCLTGDDNRLRSMKKQRFV